MTDHRPSAPPPDRPDWGPPIYQGPDPRPRLYYPSEPQPTGAWRKPQDVPDYDDGTADDGSADYAHVSHEEVTRVLRRRSTNKRILIIFAAVLAGLIALIMLLSIAVRPSAPAVTVPAPSPTVLAAPPIVPDRVNNPPAPDLAPGAYGAGTYKIVKGRPGPGEIQIGGYDVSDGGGTWQIMYGPNGGDRLNGSTPVATKVALKAKEVGHFLRLTGPAIWTRVA